MGSTTSDVPEGKIPLWLDCDPGHDDAFAILLAVHHPAFNLLGISTVHGNAPLSHTTENARRVLATIHRSDVQVFPGTAKPFCRAPAFAFDIHGSSGLDTSIPLPDPPAVLANATNFLLAMHDALLACPPQTAWVVATGTLTNVALLFSCFPSLASHIAGLSIMGGAIGNGFTSANLGKLPGANTDGEDCGQRCGNWTKWAEFNIFCDPESAESIFSNPTLAAKTTLIPLDLTHQVLVTSDVASLVLHGHSSGHSFEESSDVRKIFYGLLTFFAATYFQKHSLPSPPLHDPLAVAAVLAHHPNPEYQIPFQFNSSGAESMTAREEHFTVSVVTSPQISNISSSFSSSSDLVKDSQIGVKEENCDDDSETGRTIARLLAPGSEGISIPRGVDLTKFWECVNECLEEAERQ